ncbi:MAG: F0F1 ATP synthase subunit A [Candidatus Margulisbacteria bacterium]|nr:F0F1 ATP synthase subunit A [Candidatus Margulisiibacteriota bacterium]MBU1022240.1 F0F1 ATP synthase subunit A [Candidatus Margulisiibacteriota bacterium]MBU1729321.1 F0F1 ATP synthase subunit A [Candidatus Margulisiibacteriota bacterium]MBU1955594.1 F0F1 ATP synthase subunit A [Candidatus Margulisiibacteriota bacterium]
MDILHHFKYPSMFDLQLFGVDISVNKAILTLWIAAFCVLALILIASRKPKFVPGFFQNLIEVSIDFIKNEMLFDMPENQKNAWIPFLLALFGLIFICNIISLVPGAAAVTASLNFTGTLAVIVFITSQIFSIKTHGVRGYFGSFVPRDIPPFILPLLVPIEVITRLARPFSLAIRLFANIFAGHTIILVFFSLAIMLKSYFTGMIPLLGSVLISAFEIFIGFIQAFIFTYLSAMYITEAVGEH